MSSEIDRHRQQDRIDDATPAAAPLQEVSPVWPFAGHPPHLQRAIQRKIQKRAEQRHDAGAFADRESTLHEAAAHGTQGPGEALPHLSTIQRAFGDHDVSGIHAHTDPRAQQASSAMGALAFASGDHVAFAGQPDLHTAAHEAAHVVQQQSGMQLQGGVGEDGDRHEQHADAVADRVVGGQSAQGLLDQYRGDHGSHVQKDGGAGSTRGGALQHKLQKGLPKDTPVIRHTDGGDEDHYVIEKIFLGAYIIRNTKTQELIRNVTSADPAWCLKGDQVASRKEWESSKGKKVDQDEEDLKLGENYLSADYRRINPLLGALEALKYPPGQLRDPSLDITPRQDEVLKEWKRIAVERGSASEHDVEAWDLKHLHETMLLFKSINRVWGKFAKKAIPTHTVCRGDSVALYQSYPFLDPDKNNYADGELSVAQTIEWPGIMSTTVGDPKSHSYVQAKKVVWKITVPAEHEGKVLGGNNQSEMEATFPVGTTVQVSKLIVRRKDKKLHAGDFGETAEVIVIATITSVAESAKSEEVQGAPPPPPMDMGTDAPPPPRDSSLLAPPPPLDLGGTSGSSQEAAPKKLSVSDQMQLAILKRGLQGAEKEKDEERARDLREQIARIEGTDSKPEPKKLSVSDQMQLAILKRGLQGAEKEKDEERAKDLREQIARIEGEPVAQSSPGLDKAKLLERVRKGGAAFMRIDEEVPTSEGPYKCIRVLEGGAHGAYKMVPRQGGTPIVWKPSVTSSGASDEMMAQAEISGTHLASLITGGYLVPQARAMSVGPTSMHDKQEPGTAQPFIESSGATVRPEKLKDKQAAQMVAHMIADWVISNHDNNSGQFLFDRGGNVVGFDKGQAYKHFKEGDVKSGAVQHAERELGKLNGPGAEGLRGKHESAIEPEHLDPGYHPSTNFKEPAPKALVEEVTRGNVKIDFNDEALQTAILNCEALTVEDVEKALSGYANVIYPGSDKGKQRQEFYAAVATRAHRVQEDLKLIFGQHYNFEKPKDAKPGLRTFQPPLPKVLPGDKGNETAQSSSQAKPKEPGGPGAQQQAPLDLSMMAYAEADGTVKVTVSDQMIAAYLQDLVTTDAFLSDAEGETLARYWHVHADVYTVAAESQTGVYRDPRSGRTFRRSALRTLADGHCLIHGLRLILSGANAPQDIVRRARVAIALGLSREQLMMMLTQIVSDHIKGQQPPGLRQRLLALLNNNVSVMLTKVVQGLQAQGGSGRKPPAQQGGKPGGSAKGGVVSGGKQQGVAPPGEGTLAPNATYGDGEPIRGVLLFERAHYVMLDEIVAEDGLGQQGLGDLNAGPGRGAPPPESERSSGGQSGEAFWRRVEVALGEAGNDRQRLAGILSTLRSDQRIQLRGLLTQGQGSFSSEQRRLLLEMLEAVAEYDAPDPVRSLHFGGGNDPGTGASGGGHPRSIVA